MMKNKEKKLPYLAMIVLIIGIGATLYVHAQQSTTINDQDQVIINDVSYDINVFFSEIEVKTIETDEGEKTGIPLDEMIEFIELSCPSCHDYTFIADDSYQQTVDWKYMDNGVFTEEKRVFFSDTAHAFWVKNIIEIEVN